MSEFFGILMTVYVLYCLGFSPILIVASLISDENPENARMVAWTTVPFWLFFFWFLILG